MRISLTVVFCCCLFFPFSIRAQRVIDFSYYQTNDADAEIFQGSVEVSLLQTRTGKTDYNFSQVNNPITLEVGEGTAGEIHVVFENITWAKNRHKDNQIVINTQNITRPRGLQKPAQGIRVDGKSNPRGVLRYPIVSNGSGRWTLRFDVVSKEGRNTPRAGRVSIGTYLIKYPKVAWENAKSQNTCEAVNAFLEDYPNSQYDTQANRLRSNLCNVSRPEPTPATESADTKAWKSCRSNPTKACLERFLSSNTYGNDALALLTQLDDRIWRRVVRSNLCKDYQSYLDVWSRGEFEGSYVPDAELKLAGNNCDSGKPVGPGTPPPPSAEELAWKACMEAQGDSAGIPCMHYLNTYPNGMYREDAIAKLPAIDVSAFTRSKSIFSGVINYAIAPLKVIKVIRDGIESGEGEIIQGEDGIWRYLENILTTAFEGSNRVKVVAGEKKIFELTLSDAVERTAVFTIDATREPLEIISCEGSSPDSITFQLKGGQPPYVMQVLSQGAEKVEWEIAGLNPNGGIAKVDIVDAKGKRLNGKFMVRFRDERRTEYTDATSPIDLEGEQGYGWLILLVIEIGLLVWLYFIFSRRKTAYS